MLSDECIYALLLELLRIDRPVLTIDGGGMMSAIHSPKAGRINTDKTRHGVTQDTWGGIPLSPLHERLQT